jgi:hypothetical protein
LLYSMEAEPFSHVLVTYPVGIWHLTSGKAERKPMFELTFERGLLPFKAKTPLFEPLSQLPPTWNKRCVPSPIFVQI